MIDRIEIGLTYADAGNQLEMLEKRLADGYSIIGHSVYSYDGETSEVYTVYKPEKSAATTEIDSLVLATITTIYRDKTKNNERPMWRCTTDTGEKVNIFLNVDETSKDNYHLFEQAGWAHVLDELTLWYETEASIVVAMRKEGQWWNIVKVKPYIAPKISDFDVPASADEFDPEIYGNKDISEDLGDIDATGSEANNE